MHRTMSRQGPGRRLEGIESVLTFPDPGNRKPENCGWPRTADPFPRLGAGPVVIIQDDRFAATASVTVRALTTDPTAAPLLRLVVQPDEVHGLRDRSSLMVDRITTVPRSKLAQRLGRLGDDDMVFLGRAVVVFFASLASDLTAQQWRDG